VAEIEHRRYDPHHEVFQALDDDAVVWRYMDLTKLLSLLEEGALHFSRADLLGDPFEGSLTARMIETPTHARNEKGEIFELIPDHREMMRRAFQDSRPFRIALRRWTWVSCWNQSEVESDALWGRYVRAEHGLAVRTTFSRLTRSMGEPLPPIDDRTEKERGVDAAVYVGRVFYVDYDTAAWPQGNLFWPFVHKRLSFAHEQEVRAVISDFPIGPDGHLDCSMVGPVSRLVEVDLSQLIEAIFVSPIAPEWFADLVRRVCARYGVVAPVWQSALSAAPRF
jgi:hypothetical protein